MDTVGVSQRYPAADDRYASVDGRYPTVDRWYLSRGIFNMRNEIDVAVAEKAISDLSNELINVQKEKFIVFDLGKFHPRKLQ